MGRGQRGVTAPPAEAAAVATAGGEGEEDGDQVSTVSIYVKNLNFNTSDTSLKNHFDKVVSAAGGQIHSAKVGLDAGRVLLV